jgi:guanine deaminase
LDSRQLMEEAARLALESVRGGWGGPFGAVIARDREIVGRGQNRVLLSGDPTAHAEIEAIRASVRAIGAGPPAWLAGCELYTIGSPCPMCIGAVYWAKLDRVHYACDAEAARRIGFADAAQYEDLARPEDERLLPMRRIHSELGERAFREWSEKPDRRLY